MRAYAFLGRDATDYLSGVRWHVPADADPGAWVDAAPASPLRACSAEQLPWWLDQELWVVELGGDVRDTGRSLSAERGRLLGRVVAWTPDVARELTSDCARRARDRAVAALRAGGREPEAQRLEGASDTASIAEAAAAAATEDDRASRIAGHAADLVRFADEANDPVRGAAVAAYVAAHAAAGGDEREAGYAEAFAAERLHQADWLRERLGL